MAIVARAAVRLSTMVLGIVVAAAPGLGAQDKPSRGSDAYSGKELFKTYCAACHGTTAKGDGPLADNLRKRPPDLTRFAQQNAGTFPSQKVYQIIDGRQPLNGHGGPDMPVWGDAFKASREGSSDESVKARIDAIVKYLETLQLRSME
jgi:mono/diheme cytochrome c family protein